MSLPASYAQWLEALLGAPLPVETRATCHACAQCVPRVPAAQAFRPDVRCCTYVPRLPNFLVGRLLRDADDPEHGPALAPGLETLRRRMGDAEGVDPIGLEVTDADVAAYDRLLANEAFGRDPDVTCPHLLGDGRCGIWRHRNGVCATWFCRHDRGQHGDLFWAAAQRWLSALEHRLGLWAAEAVFLECRRVVDPEALSGGDWGGWTVDRAQYYRACAAAVDRLDWDGVLRVAGERLAGEAEALRSAYAPFFDLEPPARVQVGEHQLLDDDGVEARLQGYSITDWVTVPSGLAPLIDTFDGERLVQIRARLGRAGVGLSPAVLGELLDHQILVPLREH